MKITAQVKKVTGKTTLSNDQEFSILLVTNDPKALQAALLTGEQTVQVTIE